MICAQIKATFPCDIQRVWDVVTSVEQYAWRSDLSRTEVRNESQFIEYTKNGFAPGLLLRPQNRTGAGNLSWKTEI